MNHVVRVRMRKCITDLAEDAHAAFHADAPGFFEDISESASLQKVHCHKRLSIHGDTEVVHGNDVRMRQHLHDLRFLAKAREQLFVREQILLERFHSDNGIDLAVACLVDDTHAAATNQRKYFVPTADHRSY
jgi:hypothetical protein